MTGAELRLFGRDVECAWLAQLVQRARERVSGSLILRGEPGIGKTALLEYAETLASDFRVLRARCVESESELPFSTLAELLHPVLNRLDVLVPAQAAALGGALALAPPSSGDRLAVSAATLSILAVAAERRPLLCIVDDVHWLDASSAEALRFAGRRLQAEGVLLLFAATDDMGCPHTLSGLDELRLAELDRAAAAQLLTAAADAELSPAVVENLLSAANGNPLALLELPKRLSPQQLAGRQPIADPIQVGTRLQRAFSREVLTLPASTRRALLLAAVSDGTESDSLTRALRIADLDLSDLHEAEAAGLISLAGGRATFRHPLVRLAVHSRATDAERRWAHGVLADVLKDPTSPRAADRRVYHLLSAAVGPSEDVAAVLEQSAHTAVERRGYAVAAQNFERAAQLSLALEQRARRLVLAADAATNGGQSEAALRLLNQALEISGDDTTRMEIEHERCRIEIWRGAPFTARNRLLRLADRVAPIHPERAVTMLIDATLACLLRGDPSAAEEAISRMESLASLTRLTLPPAALVLRALAQIQLGNADVGHRLITASHAHLAQADPLHPEQTRLVGAACHIALEDYHQARVLLEHDVASARAASAVGLLPFQLTWLAVVDYMEGRWAEALAGADNAAHLVEETGWITQLPVALAVLAKVEAGLGRQECAPHAKRALELAHNLNGGVVTAFASSALAVFELGRNSPMQAALHLENGLAFIEEQGLSRHVKPQMLPDLVDAYCRSGQNEAAHRAASQLNDLSRTYDRPSVLAAAARCRGLLQIGDVDKEFQEALAHYDRGGCRFERARTLLMYGEAVRRRKRRGEARRLLRQALVEFQRLDAAPWIGRARAELEATTETTPRGGVGHSGLTPQELQVAYAVARGLTNAEAAAQLFLSVKTVEFHLSNVYRKLGIRSRAQLVARLAPRPTSHLDTPMEKP